MLPKNNVLLQRCLSGADLTVVMRPVNNQTSKRAAYADPAQQRGLSVPQLAHELNSLLDGSIRCLGVAQRRLDGLLPHPEIGELSRDIELARDALEQMTGLLEATMTGAAPDVQLLHRSESLGEVIPQVLSLLEPMVEQSGVVLDWAICSAASDLETGLLEPVIVNGLRNAIEAASRSPRGARHVELSVALNDQGKLEICIADTGPGFSEAMTPVRDHAEQDEQANGHGLGLTVCRLIIDTVGGNLRLTSRPYGGGAILVVEVPTCGADGKHVMPPGAPMGQRRA